MRTVISQNRKESKKKVGNMCKHLFQGRLIQKMKILPFGAIVDILFSLKLADLQNTSSMDETLLE